jgi:hypothetical protein
MSIFVLGQTSETEKILDLNHFNKKKKITNSKIWAHEKKTIISFLFRNLSNAWKIQWRSITHEYAKIGLLL